MATEVDVEILYAAQLGVTLSLMRRDLDEAAVKRVLIFILERYGVEVNSISVRTISPQGAPPRKKDAHE